MLCAVADRAASEAGPEPDPFECDTKHALSSRSLPMYELAVFARTSEDRDSGYGKGPESTVTHIGGARTRTIPSSLDPHAHTAHAPSSRHHQRDARLFQRSICRRGVRSPIA